jgi:hypothetical protein
LLFWLTQALTSWHLQGRIAHSLMLLIFNRIKTIKQHVARIADRVASGRYVLRKTPANRRPPAVPGPRRPRSLPSGPAWLIKLVPAAAASACTLRALLAEPDMLALLETAPGPLRRPLRSLCRMLDVAPPPILALPARAPRPSQPQSDGEQPPTAECRAKPTRETRWSGARPSRVRYVGGLRYPSPFKNPV